MGAASPLEGHRGAVRAPADRRRGADEVAHAARGAEEVHDAHGLRAQRVRPDLGLGISILFCKGNAVEDRVFLKGLSMGCQGGGFYD